MRDFAYIRPQSVAEAVTLLEQEDARALSGGTDLLVQLREGRRQAQLVVDIKFVPEVTALRFDPVSGLELGAAVPCWRIARDPVVAQMYPGLIDAVALVGGVQIQGRATVGGNLCNASPAGDTIPALIVHQAVCIIAGPDGWRELPVAQFCTGPGRNALTRGELLVSLRLPPPSEGFGAGYLRFIPRNEMDIAVVGAAAAVVLDKSRQQIVSARVALGAVAPTPLPVPEAGSFLEGLAPTAENLLAASEIARGAARPITDMRGTAAQRTHLAGVLTRRALERAIERAGGRGV